MSLTYNIKIAPTLDEKATKKVVDNLQKAIAKGKVGFDLTPVMDTFKKMENVCTNIVENFKDIPKTLEKEEIRQQKKTCYLLKKTMRILMIYIGS